VQPNEEVLKRFYGAFAARDGAGMAACYAPGVTFYDPVFCDLHGAEAGAMWRMLTGRAQDLEVELLACEADSEHGSARWRADYTYTQTDRRVTNHVNAGFRFADGAIADHVDTFSFYRWARQALGPPGLLLGWTPMLRSTVRKRARDALDEFMAQEHGPPAHGVTTST
jgi:ketosteroid isomerase-like protein